MIVIQQLDVSKLDFSNPQEAIKKMADHIAYLQENLMYVLYDFDSRITAINERGDSNGTN